MLSHKLPPGPRALPLVGNSATYRKDRLGYLTRLYQAYGPTSSLHLGSTPVILLTRPAAIREVLVDQASKFLKGEYIQNRSLINGDTTLSSHPLSKNKPVAKCCGCGQEQSLFSTDGELHDRQRAAMLEAFHGPAMERYREIMIEHTQKMLEAWVPDQEIELTGAMQRLAASVVFETLFGVDVQDRSETMVEAYRNVLRHSPSLFRPFKSAADVQKEESWTGLMSVVDEILEQAKQRNNTGKSTLLVDLILRGAPANRAGETIRDHVTSFMGAGQITVSSLLTWAVCLLAEHRDVLARLIDELQTTLNGKPPLTTDLPRLTYLDWVVKEALRLYPTVWLHGRRATQDTEVDGWYIPKGMFVIFSEWVTQRSPEYFSDPLNFQPERFAPKYPRLHTPAAYFPFGIGARACIGTGFAMLEAKIVLSMMLQRFAPVLVDSKQLEPTTYYAFLQPRGEVSIRLEKVSTRQVEVMATA